MCTHSSKEIHAIGYSLVALLSLTNSKLIAPFHPLGFFRQIIIQHYKEKGSVQLPNSTVYMYMHFLAIAVAAYSEAKNKLNTGSHGMVQYSHTLVFIVAVQFGNQRLFRHVYISIALLPLKHCITELPLRTGLICAS